MQRSTNWSAVSLRPSSTFSYSYSVMGSLAEAAAHRLRTRRGVAKVRASMSSVAMAYTYMQKQVSWSHAGTKLICCYKVFRSGKPWLMVPGYPLRQHLSLMAQSICMTRMLYHSCRRISYVGCTLLPDQLLVADQATNIVATQMTEAICKLTGHQHST